jgi:DNA polymerase III epsilon subunit-like protein
LFLERPAELFIVVDVEAAGPNPSQYAMLSIGACTVSKPQETFYVELQPDSNKYKQDAIKVSGLTLEYLKENGKPPHRAMEMFAGWLADVLLEDTIPVFTAFNAPFDWMFVNDYFHRYLGYNPFGYKALDIKALYMGLWGGAWQETSHYHVSTRYSKKENLLHHALEDAIQEAELFEAILSDIKQKGENLNDLSRQFRQKEP